MSSSYNNIPPAQWPMCTPYPISLPDSLVNISKPLVKKKIIYHLGMFLVQIN